MNRSKKNFLWLLALFAVTALAGSWHSGRVEPDPSTYTRFGRHWEDGQADLNYARKMRESHLPNCEHLAAAVGQLVAKTGKVDQAKVGELSSALEQAHLEIQQHTVGPHFQPAHDQLLLSLSRCQYALDFLTVGDHERARRASQIARRSTRDAVARMRFLMSTRTF